ncbi:MAG: hypothetical protein ACJ760_09605 [Thermoleophilaceae bacterium]
MAALPPAPAPRRLAAWLYTGPLGHLWSMVADIATLWGRWAVATVRERYSKR